MRHLLPATRCLTTVTSRSLVAYSSMLGMHWCSLTEKASRRDHPCLSLRRYLITTFGWREKHEWPIANRKGASNRWDYPFLVLSFLESLTHLFLSVWPEMISTYISMQQQEMQGRQVRRVCRLYRLVAFVQSQRLSLGNRRVLGARTGRVS